MRNLQFGKAPSGKRLERIKSSPNFKNGKFQNIHYTPQLAEGYGYPKVIYDFLFKKTKNLRPKGSIPSVKTDLINLPADLDVLIWFGHSSYFLQVDGTRFLVDPVFSGNASPISGTNKAFDGSNGYSVEDMPDIDYLLITHDHYDHLDYKTVTALRSKVKTVICGLGVGEHLEYWGYDSKIVHEKDWHEQIELKDDIVIYACPARHFSGRGFFKNNTLWLSFVLKTPTMKLFIGGDSGFDDRFKEIGNLHGPFDLVILENGQYNLAWHYIHMLPDEVLQAAKDLKAKRLLPVHSSKFVMSQHSWDEPLTKITELNIKQNIPLVTPMIGEPVDLKDESQRFSQWWLAVK